MTPPLSRDLRSPCGLPAARLSGKPKQKDSENGKALKNRGLRGSKRIYRNFVAVLIAPFKATPTASTAIKTLMSSTLMLPPNPFGLFSHAP